MTKDETRAAVEAEIEAFRSGLKTLSESEVRAIHAAEVAKYGPGSDALRGAKTEISAALQIRNPPPHALPEEHASKVVSRIERESQHDECRALVSDHHRVLSDHARSLDPNHKDAHHFVQKLHGTAIWREVDRLVAVGRIS